MNQICQNQQSPLPQSSMDVELVKKLLIRIIFYVSAVAVIVNQQSSLAEQLVLDRVISSLLLGITQIVWFTSAASFPNSLTFIFPYFFKLKKRDQPSYSNCTSSMTNLLQRRMIWLVDTQNLIQSFSYQSSIFLKAMVNSFARFVETIKSCFAIYLREVPYSPNKVTLMLDLSYLIESNLMELHQNRKSPLGMESNWQIAEDYLSTKSLVMFKLVVSVSGAYLNDICEQAAVFLSISTKTYPFFSLLNSTQRMLSLYILLYGLSEQMVTSRSKLSIEGSLQVIQPIRCLLDSFKVNKLSAI